MSERSKCIAKQNSEKTKKNNKFNQCTTNYDCRTRSGRKWDGNIEETCSLLHPEDCSICTKGNPSDINGTCTCVPPRRCALCTKASPNNFYINETTGKKTDIEIRGYFRLDGQCSECPKHPEILFVFFFLALFLVIIGGFYLSQKDFNIAFISIGVDYFQVLSIFKSAKVEWPLFLKELLNIFTLFSFDIDVAAPECIIHAIYS